jgi:hypothetical protein
VEIKTCVVVVTEAFELVQDVVSKLAGNEEVSGMGSQKQVSHIEIEIWTHPK